MAVSALAAIGVGALTLSAAAGELEPPGFTFDARCSPDGVRRSVPTHICQQGDLVWTMLAYGGPSTEFTVCVRLGRKEPSCSSPQHTAPGRRTVVKMPTKDFVGDVIVSWHTPAGELGKYKMRFVEYPVVPAFGLSPLVVSGSHRLFGLILRHVRDGLRVRAWRDCGYNCPLPLRLVSKKGETRHYRTAGRTKNWSFSLGDRLFVFVDVPGQRKMWGRLYRGRLVRYRAGGPHDTAIQRIGPPICSPSGLPFDLTKRCSRVRHPKAALDIRSHD